MRGAKQINWKSVGMFCLVAGLGVVFIEGTGLASVRKPKPLVASNHPSMIDSFLDHPVHSTDELVSVLQKDSNLRRRYARHFGLPEERIVAFIKNALVIDHLKEDQVVNNYCVTRTGRIYSLRQTFKKGTKLWALRDGTPILRWACANPLSKRLPISLVSRRPRLSPENEILGKKPLPDPEVKSIAEAAIPDIPVPDPALAPTMPPTETAQAVHDPVAESMAALESVTTAPAPVSVRLPGTFGWVPVAAVSVPMVTAFQPQRSGQRTELPEPGTGLLMILVPIGLAPAVHVRCRSNGSRRAV